jgi:ligand-binding sensor domain-containing protein/signal transduction histidine kinase
LGGALKRDDSSSDTLYFKFHVDPLSDASSEEYFAAFELYEGEAERLGVGNALKAWAYSAFLGEAEAGMTGKTSYFDLHSSKPEPLTGATSSTYELPRRGLGRTIVFKVQYVPGGEDLVTVWLNPDLGPGANEAYQPESLTTRFSANAAFDSIRLRHGGGGDGWTFSGMEIATSFNDFVDTSSAKTASPNQEGGLERLPFSFQSWHGQQGMPHGSIHAFTQSRDGYLWLGGDNGLARFDGVRFVQFGSAELHGAPVRSLFGDRSGRLWIGTGGGGLVRFDAGRFTTFRKQQGLPDDSISALAEDQDGQLWVGTEAGLAVFHNGQFVPSGENELQGKPITLLCRDRQGNMWVGATSSGIFRFKSGKFTELIDSSLQDLLRDPHCLLVDAGGHLWIGAGDDFVLYQENNQWHRYRIPRHSGQPYVKVLAEEFDGTVWAGSVSEGLFQFKGGKLKAVDAGSGLSDNRVKSLFVDREGKLWVGTDSGLNRLRYKTFFAFGQDEGLGYGPVLGIAEVAPGVVWAARPSDGIYHWEGKNFNRLTASGLPLRDPQVNALLVTRDGSCLVAHAQGLLRFKDPQAVADECAVTGLSDPNIISLAEDSQGSVWAGTRHGALWRLTKGQWSQPTNLSETHPITAIIVGANNSLWIGTDGGGLHHFKGNVRSDFGKNSGLGSDSIRTLYLDRRDILWIGTAGGGLSWWRDGRIRTLGRREGLPNDTVSQILEDDAGNLWLGCHKGIVCVSRLDLLQAGEGQSRPLSTKIFDRADGLPSEECTGGFFPAGLRTKSGLLWFSTSMGVVATRPRVGTNSSPSPTVLIEEITVDDAPVGRPEQLNIPPGRHRIEVQYTGLGADAPETLQFRYRLQPLDADWVDAGGRRTAFYNYLPPGDYRFQVNACERDGVWNESGASITVKVSRHFWQSWWFLGLALSGLMASIAGAARLVERAKHQRRLKSIEQERRLERERTRIAQDLHDQMGANLCRISFLSEHARRSEQLPNDLRHEISSISDASREVLHSLDEIVWAVDPRNDTLEHVASYIAQYAQEYFQMTGIDCTLSVPARLPADPISSQMRHHLFLAAHEAFTNVLKHSGASRASVSIQYDGSAFELTVSDNGSGFNPPTNDSQAFSAGHDGLRNMAQRLVDIGGCCRVESQPGRGTIVRFVVPVVQLKADLQT